MPSLNNDIGNNGIYFAGIITLGCVAYTGYNFMKWGFNTNENSKIRHEEEKLNNLEKTSCINMLNQCTDLIRLTNSCITQRLKERQK
jgi:hypothetical protein